jgi:hypothetical protein
MKRETVMTSSDPVTIVRAALAKGEFEQLLLGAPEYQFRSKYSPAPGNTDLTELLEVVFDRLDPEDRKVARDALVEALRSLSGTYDGIVAIATCLLIEMLRRSDGRNTLGLPVEELGTKLQATIRAFEPRLRADKTNGGDIWPDGLLGDLRRLSRITEGYGGPSFCK